MEAVFGILLFALAVLCGVVIAAAVITRLIWSAIIRGLGW